MTLCAAALLALFAPALASAAPAAADAPACGPSRSCLADAGGGSAAPLSPVGASRLEARRGRTSPRAPTSRAREAASGEPESVLDQGSASLADHFPWIGVRLGGLAAVFSASRGTPTAAGGGAYLLFDGRDYLADLSADLYFGDDARLAAGGLGVYYAFTPENVTPYAGGGLKLGYTRFGGNGTFGLQLFAAAGVLVGRSFAPQLRVELAWFAALASEDRDASMGGGGSHAQGPLLTLGIAL